MKFTKQANNKNLQQATTPERGKNHLWGGDVIKLKMSSFYQKQLWDIEKMKCLIYSQEQKQIK